MIAGEHFARVHVQTIWRKENSDLPGGPLFVALHFYKNIGKLKRLHGLLRHFGISNYKRGALKEKEGNWLLAEILVNENS